MLSVISVTMAQHHTVQHSTARYSTVQYSAAQYDTVPYTAAQHSTVQHSTEHLTRDITTQNISKSRKSFRLTQSSELRNEIYLPSSHALKERQTKAANTTQHGTTQESTAQHAKQHKSMALDGLAVWQQSYCFHNRDIVIVTQNSVKRRFVASHRTSKRRRNGDLTQYRVLP